MNDIIKEFSVSIYGSLEPYSETISKGRCRIFYKGENRNGSYISDEFAESLLTTIPYTPVKGIYDVYDGDYTDHGNKRSLGRIYGIVPEKPNIQWEEHDDEDGVKRTYACVDVLIFTALYEEAGEIIGSSQSMELYDKSIEGEWKIINGKRLFCFSKACFLGLQVLGEDVEPCFEGAAFFSLYQSMQEMIKKIEEYSLNFQKKIDGGKSEMDKLIFKLSDSQKHDALWSLLNDRYNADCGWEITYAICDIYDDYAIAYNYESGEYQRVYYIKDDATDSLSLGEKKRCYIIDVTEEEKGALNALQQLNGGTYTQVDEKFSTIETLQTSNSEFEQKIAELENEKTTLITERDNFSVELAATNEKIASMQAEIDSLNSYKLEVEKNEKEAVLAKYTEQLSEEVIDTYRNKLNEYTVSGLDKDLAYELVQSNPSIFTKNPIPQYVPKDEPQTGIEALLSKYKK